MTRPDDRETAAIERLLANRSRQTPPPELRTRVLAAVEDVLKKVPATKSAEDGGKESPTYPDLVAGTFCFWTALSLLLATTLSSDDTSVHPNAASDLQLISLAHRAKVAGVTLEADSPCVGPLAGHDAGVDVKASMNHTMRSIDALLFFQGEL